MFKVFYLPEGCALRRDYWQHGPKKKKRRGGRSWGNNPNPKPISPVPDRPLDSSIEKPGTDSDVTQCNG